MTGKPNSIRSHPIIFGGSSQALSRIGGPISAPSCCSEVMQVTPLCRTAANIASKSCYTFNCREFFILASQRPLLDATNPHSARRQSLQRPTPSKSNAQPGKRFRTSNGSQFTDIVFPDPNRPDLYYHFVNPPTPLSLTLPTFALSFLRESPPSVDSATVIGWLLAQTHKVNVSDASTESSEPLQSDASLQDFRGNRKLQYSIHLRRPSD